MARKSKKKTKKKTKKATPKRKASTSLAKRSTQLQVMTQAREHFDGKIILMGELDNTVPGFVSTQCLALDWICGRGLPQSRIVDITSDEGCGKSTFGDHIMTEIQRIGGHAYLWDTENARSDDYQARIGMIRRRAGQIEAQTMEDGFETMIELVAWHNEVDPDRPGVIVWDTPAGTPTRNEVDPKATDERFGPAKLIRSYLRKLNQHLKRGRWMLFVCNQTYQGQGPSGRSYKAAYGGGGIPYYSSVRLNLSHPSKFWRTDGDKALGLPPVGQTVWAKCVKNRVAMPWRSRQICIHFGEGVSNSWEVFHTLRGFGVIQSKSGWCRFDPDGWPKLAEKYPKPFQASDQSGHMALEQLIRERPELWVDLLHVYRGIMLNLPMPPPMERLSIIDVPFVVVDSEPEEPGDDDD
jgi:recombination protein RecA